MKEQNERRPVQDTEATIRELRWPDGLPTERLVASVYDRAMRAGMFESELIRGYSFDRAELPGRATREDRLKVALNALCRFALDNDRLEELRYDGVLVADEMLTSDCWTAASPSVQHGVCVDAGGEWVW